MPTTKQKEGGLNRATRQARTAANLLSPHRETRYQAGHRMLSWWAKRMGTAVYDPYARWFDDAEFARLWDGSIWRARDSDARKFSLWSLARSVRDVPGDSAECGVYRGQSSWVILRALEGAGKQHAIFDSFEGLSDPTEEDRVSAGEVFKWKKHDLSAGESIVAANLDAFDSFSLHKGWIPDRFADVADRTFCFAHIDVDLHQPTRDSVEFFYPRLAPGGMIVCDDYGFESCPGARRAMDEFAAGVGASVIHLPTAQGLLIKR